jgi:hypothetical protein
MFGFFKSKSQLEKLIDKDGMDYAASRFAGIICRKLTSSEIAYQFILEELDAASKGDSTAKKFAANSGIAYSEYKNALQNSIIEVDGPDGPQLLLIGLAMELKDNPLKMVEFRCKVDDIIMKKFGFGKYKSTASNTTSDEVTEAWIDKLRNWADEIGLEDLRWEVQPRNRDGGFWVGFPRDIKRMRELEGLNIQDLGLTELPKEIGNLKNLQKLWASGNKLTSIPDEIGNLTLLREIDFEKNNITAIPDSIGNLERLSTIDLRYNKINYVPETIQKLILLERLDLRDQPIALGNADTPLTDAQVRAICSLGDIVRW